MVIIGSSSCSIQDNKVIIDGKTYEIPKHVKSKFSNTTSIVNGVITVNGYRFYPEKNQWKLSSSYYLKIVYSILMILAIVALGFGVFWLFNHVHIAIKVVGSISV